MLLTYLHFRILEISHWFTDDFPSYRHGSRRSWSDQAPQTYAWLWSPRHHCFSTMHKKWPIMANLWLIMANLWLIMVNLWLLYGYWWLIIIWLGVAANPPLKNICSSVGMMTFPWTVIKKCSKPPTRIVWHVRFLSTYLLGVLSKNSREMSWNPPTINDHQPMLGGTYTFLPQEKSPTITGRPKASCFHGFRYFCFTHPTLDLGDPPLFRQDPFIELWSPDSLLLKSSTYPFVCPWFLFMPMTLLVSIPIYLLMTRSPICHSDTVICCAW